MLELVGISRQVARKGEEPVVILNDVSFIAPAGHLMAVLGPTMSGKTALLEVLAGACKPSAGVIVWHGRDVSRHPIRTNEAGIVPKSDQVLHEMLSVQENIVSAILLRIGGSTNAAAVERAAHLMVLAGLEMVSKNRAHALTLPQRRRLKLAIALASNPELVLCDDFTDGLDAKSERELAALLQLAARDNPRRLVINATQNLSNLGSYDSVLLMHEGNVCFHGPARAMTHYFSEKLTEEVFPRLAKRPAARWSESWSKHRDSYYQAFKLGTNPESLTTAGDDAASAASEKARPEARSASTRSDAAPPAVAELPSLFSQTSHLLKRRWTVFRRSKGDWLAQAAMVFGLPLLVMLLAWSKRSFFARDTAASEAAAYAAAMTVLLQFFFIVMMSVRTGAAEIAGERQVLEREKQDGLRPAACLLGKLLFLIPLIAAQGAWMSLFIDLTTEGPPGHALARMGLLLMCGLAFTLMCLGISALSSTADRSRVWCLRLAAVQAPLSGALLALPHTLGRLLHPLLALHAGWGGCMETMKPEWIAALDRLNGAWFLPLSQAFAVLGAHAFLGLALAVAGVKMRRAVS